MIKIFIKGAKMLKNFVIFTLCLVAVSADGEFSVLSSPKTLSFKGNDPLPSQYVGDVLSVAMGNPVSGDAQWSVLTVNDPFNLAKGVVAVVVEGTDHISQSSSAITFPMQGSSSDESLNALSAELEAANVPICEINFNQFDEAIAAHRACFGEVAVPSVSETKNLNSDLHTADKQFLQSIAYINAGANNLGSMEKSSDFLIMRLSLESIAKAHGEKSEAMAEANKLVAATIAKLNVAAQKSSNNRALVVAIASKAAGRSKRDVVPPTPKENKYNLATYYNQNYPVMFNIILWFMVVFGFALLAICYAIGDMDPGRDSIIYRMTSTRMKKDN